MARRIVYFDMDGVLADFEGGLRRAYPTLPQNLFSLTDDELWPKVMAVTNFWENLELLPGARAMVEVAQNLFGQVAVLSAPSRRDERCLIGKNVWLNTHFRGIDLERNFVRARNKELFAHDGAILVDDQEKNCLRWRAAGGTAIHFKSCDQLVGELHRLAGAASGEVSDLYARTLAFAARALGDKKVPDQPYSYVVHLAQVAHEAGHAATESGLNAAEVLATALLHDTLEDTSVTRQELEVFAGKAVLQNVQALTKDKTLPKVDRMKDSLERILQAGMVARVVKLADRFVNLQSPPVSWSAQKAKEYATEARQILKLLGGVCPSLERRFQSRLDRYEKSSLVREAIHV